MTSSKLIVAAAISALAFAGSMTANADDYGAGGNYYDRARVVNVSPVYRVVRVAHPRRECWDQDVRHERAGYRSSTPLVLGSIIGGAVGNTMGGGRGRTVATVAGAILGASIGSDIRHSQSRDDSYVTTERVCRRTVDYSDERRADGYDVTYRYRGHNYVTRTDHRPGAFIDVRVSVSPEER